MRAFIAFTKKEWTEQVRSGRLLILSILFLAIGIMNPAVAKMTPLLFELLEESLPAGSITAEGIVVTALDSWVQFFKNIPIVLIAFVLLQSDIFCKEYSTKTLVLSLTKGFPRHKVLLSKTLVLCVLWTVGYWACFGITYAYNAYFWDNSLAQSLAFSAICQWLFGLWVTALTVLFSTIATASSGVLVGCGATVLAAYLLSLIPKVSEYLPTLLTDGTSLVYGLKEPKEYISSFVITAVAVLACLAASLPIFHKKQL